ncbi:MAG TPA: hypothetical protein VHV77_07645 [Pirellulales bacterium]|jgi:hypothetical protein|nr:hypothetical protein [Pirellulales bacterium]
MAIVRLIFVEVLTWFWACWFSLVTLSNLADGLKTLGILPAHWPFASGNFAAIEKVTEIYAVPHAINSVLFVAVIVIEIVIAVLFWRAARGRGASERVMSRDLALSLAVALFAGFLVADELFIAWPTGIGGNHFGILTALVATWIAGRID